MAEDSSLVEEDFVTHLKAGDETPPEVPSAANSVSDSLVSGRKSVTWDETNPRGINGAASSTRSNPRVSSRKESKESTDDQSGDGGRSVTSQRSGFAGIRTTMTRDQIKEAEIHGIIFPWRKSYKSWWGFTVFSSIFTIFFETYSIAFQPAGNQDPTDAASIIEYLFTTIFVADIIVYFHLAFYDDNDIIVFQKRAIANEYLKKMFWVDLVGVFPFYHILLGITGEYGNNSELAKYLSLARLAKLVRLHRVKQLFEVLQYSSDISLMTLTLTRNFAFVLVWTHFSACVFYFIAEQYEFDPDNTWIGGVWDGLTGRGRYLTSLYWSITTFTTVGYGDFSPVNAAEQIWGMVYMLINIVFAAWIIGSITLLIVKQDEKTGMYREALAQLASYSELHHFDRPFRKRLKNQLRLDFNNREIADESILQHFPSSMRRKVLRRLYRPYLMQTHLMRGIRQQFVDAFLTSCTVEVFSPDEEIIIRGNISNDLYLLVGGTVNLINWFSGQETENDDNNDGQTNSNGQNGNRPSDTLSEGDALTMSIGDSDFNTTIKNNPSTKIKKLQAGEFVNPISFFCESPQVETVRTSTVCKVLTLSRASYNSICMDHPGSVGKILCNLLESVEETAAELGEVPTVALPQQISLLRAGSEFDDNKGGMSESQYIEEIQRTVAVVQNQAALTSVRDLVTTHINKLKDDHTTRFLFAASRNDVPTITLMCNQGIDPNSSDYDGRTALMQAAMKGNLEALAKLLDYQANLNLVDVHGNSALHEAVRGGHEKCIELMLEQGAELCMSDTDAASALNQCVFDGDVKMLRRLLRCDIQIDAGDYDKRRAVHIAAAEGNIVAMRILVEFGADLTVTDRWGHTAEMEAESANAGLVLKFLQTLKEGRDEEPGATADD